MKKERKNSVLSLFKTSNQIDKPDVDNNDDLFKEMDRRMNG
jgi:hypothetical protein